MTRSTARSQLRSAQCELMECADVPDVSNEERNDDLSSTVPSETPWQCKPAFSMDKMVGNNKNLTARRKVEQNSLSSSRVSDQ